MTNLQHSEQEQWKDISGYEGYYQVSNTGRIKALERVVRNKDGVRLSPGKERQILLDKDGYPTIVLYKQGSSKCLRVHRLVASAFLPNSNNSPVVNHIDGIKSNNNVSNLEWVSHSENCLHAFRTGLRDANTTMKGRINEHNVNSRPVAQINLLGNIVRIWPSGHEAQRHGFSNVCINNCCRGKNKTHAGFFWQYHKQ